MSLTGSTVLAGTTLRGNVNWQDPRDDITDKRLTYRSEWYGTLDVSRPFDQLTLGSTLRVAGSRYADSGNTKELLPACWSTFTPITRSIRPPACLPASTMPLIAITPSWRATTPLAVSGWSA